MSETVRQAFVGGGANLGDRRATLHAAVARLATWPGIVSAESSSFYETVPVGVLEQPMFLNLVIGVETTLTPELLLTALIEIEQEHGRVRTERWGPRTLDLDLLMFEGETRATDRLQLPHPRMFERAFVLVPLSEMLARPRFRKACWTALAAQLATLSPQAGVKRIG